MENLIYMILPSFFSGLTLYFVKRSLDRADRRSEHLTEARREETMLVLKNIGAVGKLGEATALAIKRGKCNGEMDAALEYYAEQKHGLSDYLLKQTVNANH